MFYTGAKPSISTKAEVNSLSFKGAEGLKQLNNSMFKQNPQLYTQD